MARPFVYFGSALSISLLIYSYCGVYTAAAVFLVSAIFVIPVYIFRRKHDFFKKVFVCLTAVIIASVLFTSKTVTEYTPSQALCTENLCTVNGTLQKYNNEYGNHYYTLRNISVNGKKTNLNIRITSRFPADAQIGDIITFDVTGISSFEGADSEMSHKAEDIYIRAYSKIPPDVIPVKKTSVSRIFENIRQLLTDKLLQLYPETYAGIIDGILTGNKEHISPEIQKNFSFSGISHLFAVSGFHLSFWTAAIYMLLRNLPFRNSRRIQSLISIIFVLFFMGFTGFSNSVVRAGIMQILYLSSGFVKRQSDSLNSLFVALTVILLIFPFAITSLSLQMSFLATLGIITISDPLLSFIKGIKTHFSSKALYRVVSTLLSSLVISLVASFFTVLISSTAFGYYSVAAPITNMLCLPVAELIMPLSLLNILFSFFKPLSKLIILLNGIIIKYILKITEFIAGLSWSVVDTEDTIRLLCLMILTVTMFLCVLFFYKNKKHLGISALICICTFLLFSVSAQISDMRTHSVTVCDVGNGTAVCLRTGKRHIVIGCGGNDYSLFNYTNTLNDVPTNCFDLLLIPRNTQTESSYIFDILENYNFENIIASSDNFDIQTELMLSQSAKRTNEFNVRIDGRTNLLYINNESFSGARIVSDTFTCTILFRANSDFSAAPRDWASGDLLVTRESIPYTSDINFSKVFVSSDLNRQYSDNDIYSTYTYKKLIFKTSLTGGGKVYAVI